MAYTWDRYGQDLHRLVVRALRELLVAVSARPDLSAQEFAALAAIVTDKYGRAAAGSALLALENTRLDAGVFDDLPRPEIVPPATAAQSMATASWAWNQSRGGALGAAQRFAGPLGKLVRQPARQTVWNASVTAGTRYVRVPGPKACWFCLMLCSRGAVYTKETVTHTTGARTRRPEGLRYHDNCDCSARESLTDADLPQIVRDLQDEWYEATYDDEGRPLPGGLINNWREHIAATRPDHTSVRP